MSSRVERSRASPTWASLRIRNYRIYFLGQLTAMTGVWMQVIALAWLVLELTGSGTSLGLVIGSRFLPVLLLGPWGGLLADRSDTRRVLRWAQAAAAVLALTMALLVITDWITLWAVYLLAVSLGLTNVVDGPARQSFISELVPDTHLRNAVTLNSVMVYTAQIVGPAIAGGVIALTGVGVVYAIYAATCMAVIVSLVLIDDSQLQIAPRQPAGKGQIREGLRYVRQTPALLATVVMLAVAGTFAWEYQITIPLLAKEVFDGDAGTLGLLMSCMGIGAITGGLMSASRETATPRSLALACMLWGITLLGAALVPFLWLAPFAMLAVGYGSILFTSTSKSALQLGASPQMRGRVMALWSMCVTGSTPIGAPIVGWVGDHIGPRWSLGVGTIAAVGVGAFFYVRLSTERHVEALEDAARV